MPTSYQSPMRQDKDQSTSHSQTAATNLSTKTALVADVLGGKDRMAGKERNVYSIKPDQTLKMAVESLRDRRIGALVVTDDAGALVGILSERDIVRKLADTPGQTLPQLVRDVMTKDVETCSKDDPIVSVLKQMTAGKFRHMPVVQDGALVGMLTIGDVVNYRLTELEHEALQLKQLIVG